MTGSQNATEQTWTGQWVAERLPATVRTRAAPLGIAPADLVGLALRRNPRRAHLLVSRVLGKHVPADPRLVYGTGLLLGELVRRALTGEVCLPREPARILAAALDPARAEAGAPGVAELPKAVRAAQPDPRVDVVLGYPPALVLGYAETATGLGHAVADALRASSYLHSTRRPVPGASPAVGFAEEHSHAVAHLLLPADPDLLGRPDPLVLVDDELSTGTTALNTVAALQRLHPRRRYVIATLLDLRTNADRARMTRAATLLGTRIDVVALAAGRIELPADVLTRGAELAAAALATTVPAPVAATGPFAAVRSVDLAWPAGLAPGGRHGVGPAHREALDEALPRMAERLAGAVGPGERVLVLGVEEFLHLPVRLAVELAARTETTEVRVSSTTRSPVLAVDADGYAIRTALSFPAHDDPADGPGERYAYNVLGPGGVRRFDTIVLVLDAAADTPALRAPGGLLESLRACTGSVVLATVPEPRVLRDDVPQGRLSARRQADKRPHGMTSRGGATLPEPLRGPDFGSYDADEVGWLLTDLSHVVLEAPLAEREAAVQSGRAHYAESLPIEYQPGPAYLELFDAALAESAGRVAHAVGLVTEAVLARRGAGTVLVSLARAGTPIGILMRRWAAHATGLRLPHYTMSIVRDRGIDPVALRWLSTHHNPADVVFVDGWTGKGTIARELRAALAAHAAAGGARFRSELAVLSDPGCAAPLAGTRQDFLIPSACLNSTVSGLVSRTVLRADLIGPGDFHGAKFYPHLAPEDVSHRFLDEVTAQFPRVEYLVSAGAMLGVGLTRPVTWHGWAAVERICAAEGIADVNLVKPGVGETTRVLLRRVPRKVLVHVDAGTELDHIRLLAAERGVPLEPVADLPYSCVGIIAAGSDA